MKSFSRIRTSCLLQGGILFLCVFSVLSCRHVDYDVDPYSDALSESGLGFYIDGFKFTNHTHNDKILKWDVYNHDREVVVILRVPFKSNFDEYKRSVGLWTYNESDGAYLGEYMWLCLPLENITIGEPVVVNNPENAINFDITFAEFDYNPRFSKTITLPVKNLAVTYTEVTKSSIHGEFSAEIQLDNYSTLKMDNGVFHLLKNNRGLDFSEWLEDKNRVGYE